MRPKRRGGAHPPLWSYGLKRRSCGPRTPALGAALRRSGSVQDMLACSGRASVSESVRPSSQPTAPQVTARRGGEGAKIFVGSGQRALEAGVSRGRLAFETAREFFFFPKFSIPTMYVCECRMKNSQSGFGLYFSGKQKGKLRLSLRGREAEGPQHLAFPEISRGNRVWCSILFLSSFPPASRETREFP